MKENSMKWGIALAGGGTKGSYHIGAWRAVRELGIEISAICGTSIGAVNGALIVADDYECAERIWDSVEMTDIIKLSEDAKESKNLFDIKNVATIANDIYKNKGIDFTPFEKMLRENIDEDKLRNSEIDFGLVTFNISEGKGHQVFLDEIPQGKLCEYLIASATFPGIKPKKIGESLFIDGGVTNNMPVDMLIERECDNIIAVNVGGLGFVKSANVSGRNIINVSPTQTHVGMMDFNADAIGDNILQGYYDTLKAFGKFYGELYYFNTSDYFSAREKYSTELLSGIEIAGKILGIDRYRAYNTGEFIELVLSEYSSVNKAADKLVFKLTNEKNIMCAIANAIVRGNTDLLNNKIVSGLNVNVFEAARALAYFIKTDI